MVERDAPSEGEQQVAREICLGGGYTENSWRIPKYAQQESEPEIKENVSHRKTSLTALVLPNYSMVLQIVEYRQRCRDRKEIVQECKYEDVKAHDDEDKEMLGSEPDAAG